MINQSHLLGLFGGTSTFSTGSGGSAATAIRRQPTAPWALAADAKPSTNSLVTGALAGRKFINESGIKIDLGGVSADYKKLFALYSGLETLSAVADRASVKNLSASEQANLARRFAAGMSEVGTYLTTTNLKDVRVVQGGTSATSKTTAGVARESTTSVTGPVHEGDLSTAVAAFDGDVRFDITIRTKIGSTTTTKTVAIDLSEMGGTARTMDAVVTHINGKLEAQNVATRLEKQLVKPEPKTVTANGRTTTLPAGPDQWSLAIKGASSETVGFSAPAVSDAVYVVQQTGKDAASTELLKFQSDGGTAAPPTSAAPGESTWVEGRVSQGALPEGIKTVRASAVGPDGSLWMVADAAAVDNQPIKGVQDVALMKFDSAGRLLMTRTLGAADSASGYALAVSDDGRVAVAGSVTGALEPGGTVASPVLADSFVTVFDAQGEEMWTQRRGAKAADEATSVNFGADGKVYVAGRSQSAMSGTFGVGGWDSYVQAFSTFTPYEGAKTLVTQIGVSQFGTAGADQVDAMTVDGSNLYTAGVENGRAVIRRFTLDGAGALSLAETRDLGPLSGEISGVAVADGRVIVTGTSRNAELASGMTTNGAHAGGSDVFVAALGADLAASGDDRLTWYGGEGDDTAADVKVHDGKVWITGVADRAIGAKETDATRAYLARLDPLSGAVEYERQWFGTGDQARASTLAVASGGASVLDRLGLPQGEIDQSDSEALTAATSLRTGDRLYVSSGEGGRKVAVSIAAGETLTSLARKIQAASGGRLVVKVTTESHDKDLAGHEAATAGGFSRLSITPRNPERGAVLSSGETGRDALAGLGLTPGYIGAKSGDDIRTTYGLNLPANLNLNDAGSVATAKEKLAAALRTVRSVYAAMNPNLPKTVGGAAPAYISAQIANYQAALDRLVG